MAEDTTQRLLEIRAARMARLDALLLKQAQFGPNLPAEDLVEIRGIRRELGMVEAAVQSPLSDDIVEQLGPTGRYFATDGRLSAIVEALGALGARVDERFDRSDEDRHVSRRWLVGISIAVAILATGQALIWARILWGM